MSKKQTSDIKPKYIIFLSVWNLSPLLDSNEFTGLSKFWLMKYVKQYK